MKSVLITATLTGEQERNIIASFTEDQRALFQTMRTRMILEKAGVKYSAEEPLAHVVFAAEHDGAIALLNILLQSS